MFCDKSETEKNHDLIYIIYHITTTKNKQSCMQQHPLWSPAQIIKVANEHLSNTFNLLMSAV